MARPLRQDPYDKAWQRSILLKAQQARDDETRFLQQQQDRKRRLQDALVAEGAVVPAADDAHQTPASSGAAGAVAKARALRGPIARTGPLPAGLSDMDRAALVRERAGLSEMPDTVTRNINKTEWLLDICLEGPDKIGREVYMGEAVELILLLVVRGKLGAWLPE